MNAKSRSTAPVTVHALLAALALSAAYFTWTRDRAQVQSEWVVALDLAKRDVTGLVYEDENRTVKLEKRAGSDGEPYSWVSVTSRSKQLLTNPIPTPTAPGAAPPAATPPAPEVKPAAPTGKPAAAPAPTVKPAPAAPAKPPQKGGEKAAADKDKPSQMLAAVVSDTSGGAAAASPHGASPAASPHGVSPHGDVPAASPHGAAPAVPAGAPPAPPASGPIHEIKETVTTKEFRGSDQADKLFDQFAPMRVVRSLGNVDEKKAKELGLDSSKKSLTVLAKGQPVKFTLGQTSYGSGDVYARDPQGNVYLLSHRMVSDFEFAESRLMERRMHRFERADFDRIEAQVMTASGPKTRTFIQKNRQDATNFYFVDAASPDKRDDTLRNWVDKILRMAINDYVNKGEEPQAATPIAGSANAGDLLTLRFFDGKKQIGEAVFSRYPKAGQTEYYARTETTLGMVRLLNATAESALQDAEKW
jgi:hypothetical protein